MLSWNRIHHAEINLWRCLKVRSMEEMKIAANTFGVVRSGPLAMRAIWEILPIRMLRLLVEIEEAEKTHTPHQSSTSGMAAGSDLTRARS
jgi:hypothetical protein